MAECITVIKNIGQNTCNISVSATPSAELGNGTFNLTVVLSWTAAPAAASDIYISVTNANNEIVAEHQTLLPNGTSFTHVFTLQAPADNEIWTVMGAFVDNN